MRPAHMFGAPPESLWPLQPFRGLPFIEASWPHERAPDDPRLQPFRGLPFIEARRWRGWRNGR